MIRILNEDNHDIEKMTDEQIMKLYDEQKERIVNLVQFEIDSLLDDVSKYKDTVVKGVIQNVIPSYYFDKDDIEIVSDSDDFEDRMEEIKDILKLKSYSDDVMKYNIKDTIFNMLNERFN